MTGDEGRRSGTAESLEDEEGVLHTVGPLKGRQDLNLVITRSLWSCVK